MKCYLFSLNFLLSVVNFPYPNYMSFQLLLTPSEAKPISGLSSGSLGRRRALGKALAFALGKASWADE